MKFLVILLCLTINYLWLKDLDRFDDSWFFRFRENMERATGNRDANSAIAALAPFLFIYGIPLLVVGLLLLFLQDSAFGLPTMILHILILLVAFDRTQPGSLVNGFLRFWRKGDMEGCTCYLEQELSIPEGTDATSPNAISEFFKEQLIYRCFEKMFVMFFWYMITGPMGIVFCYISYQLRDTQSENQAELESKLVANIIHFLEWAPLRLLAVTFSLAGNFVQCFENLKHSFWEFRTENEASTRLYGYAGCALSGINTFTSDSNTDQSSQTAEEAMIIAQEKEIENLLALLERSQAIWLAVLALITIFGL